MDLTSPQRASLYEEISKRLEGREWSAVDALFDAFSMQSPGNWADWDGDLKAYIYSALKRSLDSALVELGAYLGFHLDGQPKLREPAFWQEGLFRIFITHLSTHKKFAGDIQTALQPFAI